MSEVINIPCCFCGKNVQYTLVTGMSASRVIGDGQGLLFGKRACNPCWREVERGQAKIKPVNYAHPGHARYEKKFIAGLLRRNPEIQVYLAWADETEQCEPVKLTAAGEYKGGPKRTGSQSWR